MKIDILQFDFYHQYLNGSVIASIDMFFNLQKFYDVKYNFITVDPIHTLNLLKPNNLQDLYPSVTFNLDYKTDVAIVTYPMILPYGDYLDDINPKRKYSDIKVETDKLIIIGTLESFDMPFDESRIPKNWKYNEIFFLNNPPNKATNHYFHQLSTKRLDNISPLSFKTQDYHYCRKDKPLIFRNGHYFENVGKLIFEYIYHDRKVFYNHDGLTIKDGLCYYLELFGIDPYKSYPDGLPMTKQQVIDIMTMQEDDLVIKLIEG